VPVALYVIDIDGTHLLRLAGSGEFPSALRGPLSVGPEIAPDAMAQLYAQLQDVLPDSFPFPLWLRGRAIGVLLAVRRPKESLTEIARQGTAALEVAALYTDVFDVARRRRTTSAAAEVQLNLLPPRHAPIAGGEIAGSLIPGYDVAGDWFDYVENRDGTWLAIADPRGSGPTSAAFGALVHGALRAARRSGANLESAVAAMDELTREIGVPDFTVSCVVARWHADVSVLGWINCGHPPPLLWTADDSWKELSSPENPVLGEGAGHAFRVQQRVLSPGERVILYTNGVLRRRTSTGGQFGVEGIERAVRQMGNRSAAATTRAIQTAVGEASEDPIEDDTGVVVLRVT
jgi:serine phosphatase RsbU (regulator of sigma subunit)